MDVCHVGSQSVGGVNAGWSGVGVHATGDVLPAVMQGTGAALRVVIFRFRLQCVQPSIG